MPLLKQTFCRTHSRINKRTLIVTRNALSIAVASSVFLVGCGDDNDEPSKTVSASTTVKPIAAFTKNQIDTTFNLENTATPAAKCDIKIEKVSYSTKGAADEPTTATAALMLPSGDSADCQGNRPILLYAHGTNTEKAYDLAQVGNGNNPATDEANLMAANFAAQGYIVVAPNYAGYDESSLNYHPYLIADQQATDMVDALDGARTIITQQKNANDTTYANIKDSGQLFVSGYSQGGYVAMATARLLEQKNQPVTAIAPSSGPYALAAFSDAIFMGNVNLGATRFTPLLAVGLQKKYKNIYQNPNEIFAQDYAQTQLPSGDNFTTLVAAGKLPLNALFQSTPTNNPTLDALPASPLPFAFFGFGDKNYLIKTDFRAAYVTDAQENPDDLFTNNGGVFPAKNPKDNLRKALKDNDLRGYVPQMPTLLCGGHQDPTVFYDINTGSMSAIMQQAATNSATTLNITVLDVDTRDNRDQNPVMPIGTAMNNPWMLTSAIPDIQKRFVTTLTGVQTKAIKDAQASGITAPNLLTQAAGAALLANYHGGLVNVACTQATRAFFDQTFSNP